VPDKCAYVLVRVPKSGSTSLQRMVSSVLPDASVFDAPETARTVSRGVTFYERIRNARRRWRHFMGERGAWSEAGFWRAVNAQARDGDVVAGHICYGEPQLPDFELRYITLLRDPRERILSNYNYDRVGYLKRSALRRSYATGQLKASGGSFLDYLHYLADADRRAIQPAVLYVQGDADPSMDPFEFLNSRYFHFGVLDRMDLFARGLGEKLGRPVEAEWKNRTPERKHEALSAEEARLIEQVFPQDLELYEKARDFVASA
jgi:hypothetical protein